MYSLAHSAGRKIRRRSTSEIARGGTVPASTILLIDADPAGAAAIASVLTRAGYAVTTSADPADALPKVAVHQLVIVDVIAGEQTGVDVCREIRATPAVSSIPVLCVARTDDVEERIKFLEAGADDVMARPFDDRELEARVEALLLRFQRSRDITAVVSRDGVTVARVRRTIAVHSPKGGVGTSTIATNIATAAALKKPDRVVIVDLDLQYGQVATFLDLQPRQTLADVVRDDAAMREPELLRTYATRHDSGLHVLASPHGPEQARLVTPEHVDRILSTLLEAYDQVVIDTGSWLDERTLQAFASAENVLFVVNPEIATLKALNALLEYLNESGAVAAKSTFVLNNMFGREIVKSRDVEQALGSKVEIELPYDPFLYLKAVSEGKPVVLGAPKSVIASRLDRLSTIAFGTDGAEALPPVVQPKKSGRLPFRRR
jgi:pilus assembly protein CpaE